MARNTRIYLDEILERYVHLLVYRREVSALPKNLADELDQLKAIVRRIEITAVVDCDGDGVADAAAMFRIDPTTGASCCRIVNDAGQVREVEVAPAPPPVSATGGRAW